VFLKDASNPASKVLATCDTCRARTAKSRTDKSKRKALQLLDPNIQAKRHVPWLTKALTYLKPLIPLLALFESCPKATIPPPNPPKSRLRAIISPNPPKSRLETLIPPLNLPESCLETPIRVLTPPLTQPQALGFLLSD
jgi:hypothetical protein